MIIARLIARTMLFMTVIIGSFILVSVYIQSKSSLRCQEFTTAESNNVGGPYFEPMMATSESDDEYAAGGRRQFPLSLRMSARAGVSRFYFENSNKNLHFFAYIGNDECNGRR